MCGIAGIVSQKPMENMLPLLKKMSDAIAHRGPDGEGQWANDLQTVGLAHRRLAIIDTSMRGAQPMHYKNRYSITFNGEIYNYIELKSDLEGKGHVFRTNSDTEVLLALYDEYGDETPNKIDGMFAFVIYDEEKQQLFCGRDRFGEKPFYYYHKDGFFYFASEMKALWAAGVPREENATMQYNYLAYGFLQNPENLRETFFKDIHSLEHGHYLTCNLYPNQEYTCQIEIERYYPFLKIDYDYDNKTILKRLLKQSISRRLRSDVAVGCSLSGGLDSSLVAALIKETIGEKELKTFSAVFPNYSKDESKYVQQVADHIGATSFTVTPSLEAYEADKERFLWHQEEPVVDESPYILYKVYELAKKNGIKVLLDGQGADELFAGYHAYFFTYLKELKGSDKKLYRAEQEIFETLVNNGLINDYSFFKRQAKLAQLFGEKLSDIRIWKQKIDQFRYAPIDKELFKAEHQNSFRRKYTFQSLKEHLEYDVYEGKLQSLLRYADRSSMAHGVEIRLPYLYHVLEDFADELPSDTKIKDGWTKWILRDTFKAYLPHGIVWRRDKIGAEGELR